MADAGGWNYRVVHIFQPEALEQHWYAIHEVYYDDDGQPTMCTEDAVDVSSENLDGLRWVLVGLQEALDQPVLEMADFEQLARKGPTVVLGEGG